MLDAGGIIDRGIDALAHGADHRGGRDLDGLARGNGALAAGLVGGTELHHVADKRRAVQGLRREQLAELHALGERQIKLFFVGGHLLLGAAVD